MDKKRTILYLILIMLNSSYFFGQNIHFSFSKIQNKDLTTSINFYASNLGNKTENLAAFQINFFYENKNTIVSFPHFNSVSNELDWSKENQVFINQRNKVTNKKYPFNHYGYYVYNNIDANFEGVDIKSGEEIQIGTITLSFPNHSNMNGILGYIETTQDQEGLKYSGTDFIEHDVSTYKRKGTENKLADSQLLGIRDQLATLKLFPNPCTDYVIVDISNISTNSEFQLLSISNHDNKLIKTVNLLPSQKTRIDISDLLNGIYTFTIENNNQLITKRLVKIN